MVSLPALFCYKLCNASSTGDELQQEPAEPEHESASGCWPRARLIDDSNEVSGIVKLCNQALCSLPLFWTLKYKWLGDSHCHKDACRP